MKAGEKKNRKGTGERENERQKDTDSSCTVNKIAKE